MLSIHKAYVGFAQLSENFFRDAFGLMDVERAAMSAAISIVVRICGVVNDQRHARSNDGESREMRYSSVSYHGLRDARV